MAKFVAHPYTLVSAYAYTHYNSTGKCIKQQFLGFTSPWIFLLMGQMKDICKYAQGVDNTNFNMVNKNTTLTLRDIFAFWTKLKKNDIFLWSAYAYDYTFYFNKTRAVPS